MSIAKELVKELNLRTNTTADKTVYKVKIEDKIDNTWEITITNGEYNIVTAGGGSLTEGPSVKDKSNVIEIDGTYDNIIHRLFKAGTGKDIIGVVDRAFRNYEEREQLVRVGEIESIIEANKGYFTRV